MGGSIGSEDGTAPAPGAGEKPRAIAELEAKLGPQPTEKGPTEKGPMETQPPLTQPPPNSPAQLPKEADLKSEADAMVRRFVNHLQGDEIEAARALLIDHAQIETLVSPGIRPVLEGPLLARNNDVLGVLAEVLRGKELEVKWQPGKLHSTKDRGTFRARVPLLSENVLHVDANGIPLQVQIEELVYTTAGWRIFTLKTR